MSPLGPRQHVAVVDLGFGDAGKGAIVDWLASTDKFDMVVRFSGGAQAAHHVLHPETGKAHRFAQFGSGTFRGLPTYLSRFMMVDPLRLASEAEALYTHGIENPYSMLIVDERALVTTPYHAEANRRVEILRGDSRHGSCGVGIGKTMEFAIRMDSPSSKYKALRVKDFSDPDTLRKKLNIIYHFATKPGWEDVYDPDLPSVEKLVEIYSDFAANMHIVGYEQEKAYTQQYRCIFEGSQGVLLDEWYGFHPHTTWSTTTFDNAFTINHGADLPDPRTIYKLGVLRAYTTRHGAGPFPTEIPMRQDKHEYHNGTGKFQGAWRIGEFDAVLHRYAVAACEGVDGLAVTHLDRPADKICEAYTIDGLDVHALRPKPRTEKEDLAYQERFTVALGRAKPVYYLMSKNHPATDIEHVLGVPVVIESRGMRAEDRDGVKPGWYAADLHGIDLSRSA